MHARRRRDRLRQLVHVEVEGRQFERGAHLAPPEHAQIAALLRRAALRELLGELLEERAAPVRRRCVACGGLCRWRVVSMAFSRVWALSRGRAFVRAYGRAHCGASSPRMIGRGAHGRACGPGHGRAHVDAIDATPSTRLTRRDARKRTQNTNRREASFASSPIHPSRPGACGRCAGPGGARTSGSARPCVFGRCAGSGPAPA